MLAKLNKIWKKKKKFHLLFIVALQKKLKIFYYYFRLYHHFQDFENFLKGKRGDGKNFWREEGGMLIFSDVIKRLSICNIIENHWTSEVPYFLVHWSSDVFIINGLNCNVFYLVQ